MTWKKVSQTQVTNKHQLFVASTRSSLAIRAVLGNSLSQVGNYLSSVPQQTPQSDIISTACLLIDCNWHSCFTESNTMSISMSVWLLTRCEMSVLLFVRSVPRYMNTITHTYIHAHAHSHPPQEYCVSSVRTQERSTCWTNNFPQEFK